MEFFGVPLTRLDDTDAYFQALIRTKTPRAIVTPNPEILLGASRDEEFRSILSLATDRLPDGIGLYLASMMRESRLPRWLNMLLMPYWGVRLIFGRKSIEKRYGLRLAGSRLTTMLLEQAAREGWTVAILDRDASDWPEKLESQRQAPQILEAKFPWIKIHYQIVDTKPDWARAREELSQSGATVLLSILGMKIQEASLLQFVPSVPSLRIAVGVGSSIDYHLGNEKACPEWISRIGFEWFYRIVFSRRKRMRRIKRILSAVFAFPWRVLSESVR